jgi:hypothetical protein
MVWLSLNLCQYVMQKSGDLKKLGNATTLQYSLSLCLMCPCKVRVMDAVLRLSARQAAPCLTPLGAAVAGGKFSGRHIDLQLKR